MRFAGGLLALLGLTALVRWFDGGSSQDGRSELLLALGLLLLGAWLAGRLFERLRLPKLTGYLALGLLAGPSLLGLVSKDAQANLRFVNHLAVSLIALTAGGEIRLEWLRGRVRQLVTLIAVDMTLIFGVAVGLVFLAASWVPFLAGEDRTALLVVGLLLGSVMIANSPTVVIAMLSDYKAEGPLSQTTLAVTVCKDLMLIVAFATVMAVSRNLLDAEAALSPAFLIGVLVQLFGSFVVGGVVGVAMAWYVSKLGAHLPAFVVGCCLLIAFIGEGKLEVAGQVVHLEPLLMALTAGLVMENVWSDKAEPLFHAIEETSLPVYCLFFALAGAKVDLAVFAALGGFSLTLFVLRLGSVWAGVRLGSWIAGLEGPWVNRLFLGLVPQAGVSFVLLSLIASAFQNAPWGPGLATTLFGMIVLNELLGPIGFRWALISSGEVRTGEDAA